jgi:hypothetical protein
MYLNEFKIISKMTKEKQKGAMLFPPLDSCVCLRYRLQHVDDVDVDGCI